MANSSLSRLVLFPLPFLGAALVLVHPCAGAGGTWTATGSLGAARSLHSATLLPNGKVLAAGGTIFNGGAYTVLASAELYDPASGIWTATGNLVDARAQQPETLLPNGKVLIAGGNPCFGSSSCVSASAQLYNPATGTWTFTGSLKSARTRHIMTLLPNGKVLAAGGGSINNIYLRSAELYDPTSGIWTATGSMAT